MVTVREAVKRGKIPPPAPVKIARAGCSGGKCRPAMRFDERPPRPWKDPATYVPPRDPEHPVRKAIARLNEKSPP